MKTTTPTPQQQAIEALKKKIKEFLSGKPVLRYSKWSYTVTDIEYSASGVPLTLKGTVTMPATKTEVAETIDMWWNIDGKALSNDNGADLVTRQSIKDFNK